MMKEEVYLLEQVTFWVLNYTDLGHSDKNDFVYNLP